MLMILARLVRSESFWAVVKVRSPHTGPEVWYPSDSASTNGAACNLMLANAADTLCISHTISNAGDRIVLPTLFEFTTPWLELQLSS